ncbi:MAG TPA: tricarballylate utilization 4Fe-4S protein TcuB [Beijerinckiaceae bacterium]|nr:tricarballylate utilization 4Fe-4S protein TcuB [Beijerinckiaceae bacterium]
MQETEALAAARWDMDICNACRYCEGYCAVFPAMELRREFTNGDLSYLANLCHNCKDCYYACQYSPPHEFGVNVPKAFAELRSQSYAEYAWPRSLAVLFERNALAMSLVTALFMAGVLIGAALMRSPGVLFGRHLGPGSFYVIIPWNVMTGLAGLCFLFAVLCLTMGARAFWRDTGGHVAVKLDASALRNAISDALSLRHLGGGGQGCNDTSEAFSQGRRLMHHALFYGFLLCFASTCVATVYAHFLRLQAPYPVVSLPVVLGLVGGLGLMTGTIGLTYLKLISDPAPAARNVLGADYALLVLLCLTAFTGLLLLTLRESAAMGALLAVHLGLVLAFFVLAPFSKFVHGIYRTLALIRYAGEKRSGAVTLG